MRSYVVFLLLLLIKGVSRMFYRCDVGWVGQVLPDPWKGIRLLVFLNHTSLYEPLYAAVPPNHFIWRIARHGVVPAADKTINRPIVGKLFRFIARHVVSITRQRDQTWSAVLQRIDPDSMVIILPEGRMMRATGLDASGQPMTVRGGIADILESVQDGRMLLAYSGGLHHVQVPGQLIPRVFKTIRLRLEVAEIADYREGILARSGEQSFKRAVMEDLEKRRDEFCPTEARIAAELSPSHYNPSS